MKTYEYELVGERQEKKLRERLRELGEQGFEVVACAANGALVLQRERPAEAGLDRAV